ncbi:MAG: sensor histidine kinase [bacterium JZ-2024 1]
MIITGVVFIGVGTHFISRWVVEQAQEMVRNNLNSAREIYISETQRVYHSVRYTAGSFFLKDAILSGNLAQIAKKLQKDQKLEELDFLSLLDREGRVVMRAANPEVSGDMQVGEPLISAVFSTKQTLVGTAIMSADLLRKESAILAERAVIQVIPTPMARQRPEKELTSGMVIKAAAPVLDYNERLIGVLYGGILVNRNYAIVDRIKEVVFQGVKYKGNDIGTVTIFQDDVRISTNVLNEDGSRAVGTRIAADVYDRVILKGEPYIGRAFVVNNWYIAAYEPIRDYRGSIVGVLYVGILERKYVDVRKEMILAVLGITSVGLMASLLISYSLSRSITVPIEQLMSAVRQMASGDLDTQVRINTNGELWELAETFNQMARALRKRDEELKERARKRIMESERLAMVGQLSAGVAHELNNPLQGIVTYSHLLLERLAPDDPRRGYFEKIVKQANRCTQIIHGLLDFARPTQPHTIPCNINTVLVESLSLLEKQPLFLNVRIKKELSQNLPLVYADPSQMQQVFTNILVNAAEAMDGSGDLEIITRRDPGEPFIEILFRDTGRGIPEENIERIFDPFFTTKEGGRGTGLGLAISYGIIKRHEGSIEVQSTVGKGTTFIIRLPLKETIG